jgi:amino acid adenylation domain-containing protein
LAEVAVGTIGEEPAMSPLERAVGGVWAGVLGLDRVGRTDRFIDVGGDSLSAVTLVAEMSDTFGVDLPVTAPLVEAPTVARMAALISAIRDARPTRREAIQPDIDDDDGTLSIGQEGMWFIEKAEQTASALHIPVALRLRGQLDVTALERCITELIRRHDGLRTRFVEGADGLPRSTVDPPFAIDLEVEDRTGLSEADLVDTARAIVQGDARARFVLSDGPLFRARLIRFSPDDHVLSLVIHHLVADGWSRGTIRNELAALYRAELDGDAADLPLPRARFSQFAARERRLVESGALDEALDYWRKTLTPPPPAVTLPTDRRPSSTNWESDVVRVEVPADERARLVAFSREEDVTLFMLLLASFVATLHRHTGLTDVVVGVPVAGRTDPLSRDVVGSFMNVLPVRVAVAAEARFIELLRVVRAACLDAYAHQAVPFELLVRELRPERTARHRPLVQVLFQLRNLPAVVSELGGVRIEDLEVHPGATPYELSVDVTDRDGTLAIALEYPTGHFDRDTMDHFASHLVTLLRAASDEPQTAVNRLPMVSDHERAALIRFGRGDRQQPARSCLHEVAAAFASAQPDVVAVQMAGEPNVALTYGELDRRANQLANHLVRLGVHRGDAVGLCVPRDPQLLVAVLAISKAGAAFVPIDPAHPPGRIAAMFEDAGVTTIVTTDELAPALPQPELIVALDRDRVEIERQPTVAPSIDCSSTDLAYVLFTSGSTGRPKGVEIEHGDLVSYIDAVQRTVGLSSSDAILAVTSLTFDAFIDELFVPLSVGARIVLADDALRLDAARLAHVANSGAVTHLQGTPTFASLLLDGGWQPGSTTTVWGGESMTPDLAARLLDTCAEVWNCYGPTETTDAVTFHRIGCQDVEAGVIPIGRPIPGRVARVVEPTGLLAGVGVEGELLIGGNGLARGYRGRPDLTREVFVDVETEEGRRRMYRSGDRCRWRSDGTLEFLGRADGQVKVQGVRLELGEVEAALASHPAVRLAAADVRDGRLIAWVTGVAPHPPADELRRFVAAALPRAAVPSAVHRVDRFPMSAADKVDRRALVVPAITEDETGLPPQGPVEQRLARLWRECLRLDGVVHHESDFFSLGGHSMLAVDLALRIEREFGRELPLAQFLTSSTLGAMAAALELAPARVSGSDAPSGGALVPVRPGDPSRPVVLWIPHAGGTTLALQQLASVLPAGIELMGFEAPPHRGAPEPATMSELAASYANDVRALVRAGVIGLHRPFLLAGNSFGATLAHEVAIDLFDDCRPGEVLLVDPLLVPFSADLAIEPDEGRPVPTALKHRAAQAARVVRRTLRATHLSQRPRDRTPVARPPLPPTVVQAQAMSYRLRTTYVPKPYPGSVVLVTSEGHRRLLDDDLVRARPLVLGQLVSHPLPGKHGGLLEGERVHRIAAIVGDVVNDLDGSRIPWS